MKQKLYYLHQGPAGMYFQLWDGSGSGIGKNFWFGSGIRYICKKNNNQVFSGIGNLDRVSGRWKFTFITEYPLGPLKPRKCSAILLVGYIFRYTTAMLKTQVTVVVQHCNSGIACYCYWYNTAVLVTQSQMELYSMMYQGLANLDVKPIWSRNVMIWYSDGTTKK